ncbi:MAG: 30S ribosomal protein S9 [Candidatus Moraniibacteriota bacterium]|nr:MAG: 30S ribosomal protein S9 [Candidatus Moranbacteria bacterium]
MATATKKTTVKEVMKETSVKAAPVAGRYVYAVGRRKTAVAQVRYYAGAKSETLEIIVNNRPYIEYFNTFEQREAVVAPLKVVGKSEAAKISVLVSGGGLSGQADAVKLGIARALVEHDALVRPALKAEKLLTRDPRAVERKKPGLKKARRAPQWAKR